MSSCGNQGQRQAQAIQAVLQSPHPSPTSAHLLRPAAGAGQPAARATATAAPAVGLLRLAVCIVVQPRLDVLR